MREKTTSYQPQSVDRIIKHINKTNMCLIKSVPSIQWRPKVYSSPGLFLSLHWLYVQRYIDPRMPQMWWCLHCSEALLYVRPDVGVGYDILKKFYFQHVHLYWVTHCGSCNLSHFLRSVGRYISMPQFFVTKSHRSFMKDSALLGER